VSFYGTKKLGKVDDKTKKYLASYTVKEKNLDEMLPAISIRFSLQRQNKTYDSKHELPINIIVKEILFSLVINYIMSLQVLSKS